MNERTLETHEDLRDLLAFSSATSGDRGVPAVELSGSDSAGLVIGQAECGVTLMWVDPLGDSWHTVGSAGSGETVVIDYMGSYTEIPAEFFVSAALGIAAARAFVETGSPFVPNLLFEPD